jgi:hypothetical protein
MAHNSKDDKITTLKKIYNEFNIKNFIPHISFVDTRKKFIEHLIINYSIQVEEFSNNHEIFVLTEIQDYWIMLDTSNSRTTIIYYCGVKVGLIKWLCIINTPISDIINPCLCVTPIDVLCNAIKKYTSLEYFYTIILTLFRNILHGIDEHLYKTYLQEIPNAYKHSMRFCCEQYINDFPFPLQLSYIIIEFL